MCDGQKVSKLLKAIAGIDIAMNAMIYGSLFACKNAQRTLGQDAYGIDPYYVPQKNIFGCH